MRKRAASEEQKELKRIGDRIRAARLERGYSQEAFAHEAGLDRVYYGQVERGEINAAIMTYYRIARALGVQVCELFPPIDTRDP